MRRLDLELVRILLGGNMTQSLKQAIQQDFDAALLDHLPVDGVPHDTALLAIGHAALKETEVAFTSPTRRMSVGEIVEEFGLHDFVEMARRCSQDAAKQGGISAGEWVLFDGKLCRTLLRRRVKGPAAAYELLIEGSSGEDFGFIPESEVEKLEDRTAETLARKCREEKLEFDEALQVLLMQGEEEPTLQLFMVAALAIGWVNMGQPSRRMTLSKGRRMTARKIVEHLGLEPFLNENGE